MTLSLNDYQREALSATVYPDKGTGSPIALAHVGLGLGAAGTLQGTVQRIFRDMEADLGAGDRARIMSDLGDMLWCLAAFAAELGLTFDEVAQANLENLASQEERSEE